MLAHVIEGGVDDQLDGFSADFGFQLPDLLSEILLHRSVAQPGLNVVLCLVANTSNFSAIL